MLPILESLEFIQENNASVVRFGDGEIDLILGHSIPYQAYDKELAEALKAILQMPSNEQLLVCLPDVFRILSATIAMLVISGVSILNSTMLLRRRMPIRVVWFDVPVSALY